MVPEDLLYQEHKWIHIDGEEATIGISDYAQEEIGDIVFVELPGINKYFKQLDVFARIESTKTVIDALMPLSGNILEVNDSLLDTPEIINDSPYEKGWICRLRITVPSEVEELMKAKDYEIYIKGFKK